MRRRIGLEGPALDEDGFTLIELVIVVVVLPIVIGGITVALLSVFGLQNSVQNRIGNSNDQLVSASTFNKDVQSAQQIETVATPGLRSGRSGTNPARRIAVGPRLHRGISDCRLLRRRPDPSDRCALQGHEFPRSECLQLRTVHNADEHQSGFPRHRGSGDELPDDTESSVPP